MNNPYFARSLELVVQKAAREFPAMIVVGPRQSDNTTLLKHLFSDHFEIVSLESPDVRLAALNDPRGFLHLYPPPVVFGQRPAAKAAGL